MTASLVCLRHSDSVLLRRTCQSQRRRTSKLCSTSDGPWTAGDRDLKCTQGTSTVPETGDGTAPAALPCHYHRDWPRGHGRDSSLARCHKLEVRVKLPTWLLPAGTPGRAGRLSGWPRPSTAAVRTLGGSVAARQQPGLRPGVSRLVGDSELRVG